MPVQECQVDNGPGRKWGTQGKCYGYTAGNAASRERANQRALAQGRATFVEKSANEDVPHGATVLLKSYSRARCMQCSLSPTNEVLWAEGMAHAWFCDTHLTKFKKDNPDEVSSLRELKYGLASSHWKNGAPTRKEAAKYLAAHKARSSSTTITFEEETEQIKLNREKPEASSEHEFQAAEWTHPNGHPRCFTCGHSQITEDSCAGVSVEEQAPPTMGKQTTTSAIQALMFDKDEFPEKDDAIDWAKEHKFKFGDVRETENQWRLRQFPPDPDGKFRVIELDTGVSGVLAITEKDAMTTADFGGPGQAPLTIEAARHKKKPYAKVISVNALGLNAAETIAQAPYKPEDIDFKDDTEAYITGSVCGACRFYLRDVKSEVGRCQILPLDVEVPWWWTSKAYISSVAEAQSILISAEKAANMQGLMVAIAVPPTVANKLQVEQGEPPSQMHITLTYHGDADEVSDIDIQKIMEVTAEVASQSEPMEVKISGTGRFEGQEEDAFHVLITSPDMMAFRKALVAAFKKEGVEFSEDHEFTPHITLAYIPSDEQDPDVKLPDITFTVNQVKVSVGGNATTMPLGSNLEKYVTEFTKADSDRRYTFGVVYKASNEADIEEDAHNEFVDAEELQESLWEHVQAGDRSIFVQHGLIDGLGFKKAGEWVEITTWPYEVDAIFELPGKPDRESRIPAGSAWMGVLWSEWAWPLVKSGQIRGYSFGGSARRIVA